IVTGVQTCALPISDDAAFGIEPEDREILGAVDEAAEQVLALPELLFRLLAARDVTDQPAVARDPSILADGRHRDGDGHRLSLARLEGGLQGLRAPRLRPAEPRLHRPERLA